MTVKHERTTFRVPLTAAFHQAAQRFYQYHSDPQKGKQVYLNTLSVQAVRFYLTCLGIETALEKSESWHPVSQALADTADLWVTGLGCLGCRPVLPASSNIGISPEARSRHSIGYLFVQFNSRLTEATLLGFLSENFLRQALLHHSKQRPTEPLENQVASLLFRVAQLQPLETFPAYLFERRHQLMTMPSTQIAPASPLRVQLQPWLAQVVEDSWASLDSLIEAWQQQNLALSFRASSARADWIEPATVGVKQGKFLRLSESSEDWLLFVVGIALASSSDIFDITIELYPAGDKVYLPPTLHMVVMDDTNTPVLQAKGRQSEGLEFKFSGSSGEQFSVSVHCEQFSLTELFEI